MAQRWRLCLLVVMLGIADVTATAASSGYQCMQTSCSFNFNTCLAQSGCAAAVQCRETCFTTYTNKLLQVNCLEGCVGPATTGDFGAVLWSDLYSCFNVYCSAVALLERCTGYSSATSCRQQPGCDWNAQRVCVPGDFQPPTIENCPLSASVPAIEDEAYAFFEWPEIVALDQGKKVPVTLVTPFSSGAKFPVGVTAVHARAVDAAGNVADCRFNVTVTDPWAPKIVFCPRDQYVTPTTSTLMSNVYGRPYTTVSWPAPRATDNVGLVWDSTGPWTSGPFTVGTVTRVTHTARDASNNTAVCSFVVSVEKAATSFFELRRHTYASNPEQLAFFSQLVDASECGARCKRESTCQAFAVSGDGVNTCILLGQPVTTNTIYSYAFDLYRRLPQSTQTCDYDGLEACVRQSGLPLPAGPACLAANNALTLCFSTNSILDRCNDTAFASRMMEVTTSNSYLCQGQTVPSSSGQGSGSGSDGCDGPWREVGLCVDCCRTTAQDMRAGCQSPGFAGDFGTIMTPDPACAQTVEENLNTCIDVCLQSRPYDTTVGSMASPAHSFPWPSSDPPTGWMDITHFYQLAGVPAASFGPSAQATFILSASTVYAYSTNRIWLSFVEEQTDLRVTVMARVPTSYVPPDRQSVSRRSVDTTYEEEPEIELVSLSRRAVDNAAFLASLLATLQSQDPTFTNAQLTQAAPSTNVGGATTSAPATTAAPTTTARGTSGTGPATTTGSGAATTRTTTLPAGLVGPGASGSSSSGSSSTSDGVIIAAVLVSLILFAVIVFLIYSFKKKSVPRSIAPTSAAAPRKALLPEPPRPRSLRLPDRPAYNSVSPGAPSLPPNPGPVFSPAPAPAPLFAPSLPPLSSPPSGPAMPGVRVHGITLPAINKVHPAP